MNIKLNYLYRDGANYKQYNQVIFANPNHRSLREIESIIRSNQQVIIVNNFKGLNFLFI